MKVMKNKRITLPGLLLTVLIVLAAQWLFGDRAAAPTAAVTLTQQPAATATAKAEPTATAARTKRALPAQGLDASGSYTTASDVAAFLRQYGRLPDNFITKKEAQALGWPGGDLRPYAPGKCIGGDRFGNYEGLLPDEPGRVWHECDIDTLGASSRGAKRLVYSNDGLIYYTADHYEHFTLMEE